LEWLNIKLGWFNKKDKSKNNKVNSKDVLIDALKSSEIYDKMTDGINAILWDMPKFGIQIIMIEMANKEITAIVGTAAKDVYTFLEAHKQEFLVENKDNPKVFTENKPFNTGIV